MTWDWLFAPAISVEFIVDAGDLDNDGKPEFLAGGLKPNAPLQVQLHVFEANGNDSFQRIALIVKPASSEGSSTAAVADLDGDGRREIVMSTGSAMYIFESSGNNKFTEIWSGNAASHGIGPVRSIGAGDHDGDGKEELIFRTGGSTGVTGVWEIHPNFQADLDLDGTVDAIDNCPTQSADAQTFNWPNPADIVFAIGPLSAVDRYATLNSGSAVLATELVEATVPAPGQGLYLLLRPDCPVGSWQNGVGSEPGRDGALP